MLRTALAVVVPFALLLPVVAPDLATILWKYGAAGNTYDLYILSLSLFGAGVVFFTVHYLVLRGFYALERTRTVFFIQCAVAATNIVVAIVLVARTDPEHTAPALVLAYTASYAVGSVVSYLVLRRVLGGLRTPELVRFLVRLAIATGAATAVALGLALLLPGPRRAQPPRRPAPAGRHHRRRRAGLPRAHPRPAPDRGDGRARHRDPPVAAAQPVVGLSPRPAKMGADGSDRPPARAVVRTYDEERPANVGPGWCTKPDRREPREEGRAARDPPR